MDEETEKSLAGLITRVIKNYNCMEEHFRCLEKDLADVRREMKNAAIMLRDKHVWRVKEVEDTLNDFIEKSELSEEA